MVVENSYPDDEREHERSGERFVAVDCPACSRVHLLNPETGRLAVSNRERQ